MKNGQIELEMILRNGRYIPWADGYYEDEILMLCYYKYEDEKNFSDPYTAPKIEITSLTFYDSGEKIDESKYSKRGLEEYLRNEIETIECFNELEG